ncbi:hypothetical protein [Selenomonas ruminantium]|uniref:Uncharacterized protein n=1 Tax=Selenomonas ruminantium TaxID=971 RepID=A0A1I0YCK7_SELRU|nr:hypothetical protein [Selenomonas ruminantium]SFB10118.1 hypothetical protein SAMN05216587_11134 [Selenomonas ruminantium]
MWQWVGDYIIEPVGFCYGVKENQCGSFITIFRGKWSACYRYAMDKTKQREARRKC